MPSTHRRGGTDELELSRPDLGDTVVRPRLYFKKRPTGAGTGRQTLWPRAPGCTRPPLAAALAEQEVAQSAEAKRRKDLEAAEVSRSDARIELKRTEHASAGALQTYEAIKYDFLIDAFAGVALNEQYVLLKLVADRVCMACGQPAEAAAKKIEQRQQQDECLVCGTPHQDRARTKARTKSHHAKAVAAYAAVERTHSAKIIADRRFHEAEQRWSAAVARLEQARADVDRANGKIRVLQRKLPDKDRNALAREEDRIQSLRREVTRFRDDRDQAEEAITNLLQQLRVAAEGIRERTSASFQQLAEPFFADQVRLVYAPRKDRIGQGGRVFEFPAFEVEMSSDGPQGDFIRRQSDQVSLSQREYLDTIFRMSLVETLLRRDGDAEPLLEGAGEGAAHRMGLPAGGLHHLGEGGALRAAEEFEDLGLLRTFAGAATGGRVGLRRGFAGFTGGLLRGLGHGWLPGLRRPGYRAASTGPSPSSSRILGPCRTVARTAVHSLRAGQRSS